MSSRNYSMRTGFIFGIIISLALAITVSAGPYPRVRDSIPDKYKWDLSDIYPGWAEWEEGMTEMQGLMDEYSGMQGTLKNGPQQLLKAFKVNDDMNMVLYKVYRYPGLARSLNSKDQEAAGKFQRVLSVLAKFNTASAWFNPELLTIEWATMEKWLNETDGLSVYRHNIEDLYRQQKHVLSEDKEKLLSYFSQPNSSAANIYGELTTSDIKYARTILSEGDSITVTPGEYRSILASNTNQADRAKAFEAFYGVFVDNENTYASIYNGILQKDWALAQARNYNSCLEAALDGDNVPVEVYKNLVSTVKSGTSPMQRYYKLRKKMLGLEKYHLYDGSIPVVDFDKKYPYDDIIDEVIESVKPLGKTYQKRMRQIFDERWIDVYENEGKRTGAFSAGTYGVHPFLLLNYNETMDYVFTVAHEVGHCMHSLLSTENQPFATSEYTIFVAEVASTLNEALLLDFMIERATDPLERIALLQQAIENIDGTFYTQSMWADYEMQAHEMVERGDPVTTESIKELYTGIVTAYYGDAVDLDEFYKSTWTRISHFYGSPYYVYKYATCYASSSQIVKGILSEDNSVRKESLDKYLTLLKSGGNDYPMEQLKKAGVDLSKSETIQAVIDKMDELVTLLEEEVAKLN